MGNHVEQDRERLVESGDATRLTGADVLVVDISRNEVGQHVKAPLVQHPFVEPAYDGLCITADGCYSFHSPGSHDGNPGKVGGVPCPVQVDRRRLGFVMRLGDGSDSRGLVGGCVASGGVGSGLAGRASWWRRSWSRLMPSAVMVRPRHSRGRLGPGRPRPGTGRRPRPESAGDLDPSRVSPKVRSMKLEYRIRP